MLEDFETNSVSDSAPKTTLELFPCRPLLKPHMRRSDVRIQSFTNKLPVKRHATLVCF